MERSHDARYRQLEVHFNRQSFAIKVIHYVEGAKRRSPHNASLMKSADQHSFIAAGTTRGAGHLVGKRLLRYVFVQF